MAAPALQLEDFPVRAPVTGDTTGYVPLYHALHAALGLPKEFRANETGGWIGDDMKAVKGKKLTGGLRVRSTKKATYRGVATHYVEVSYAAFDAQGSPVLWSQDNDPDRPTPGVLLVFHSPKGVLALTAEHLAAAKALRAAVVTPPTTKVATSTKAAKTATPTKAARTATPTKAAKTASKAAQRATPAKR